MKAYYRKVESKKAGKVSWHVFRDAKRCSGLLKYLKRNGYRWFKDYAGSHMVWPKGLISWRWMRKYSSNVIGFESHALHQINVWMLKR
jgi:hypothetical protein